MVYKYATRIKNYWLKKKLITMSEIWIILPRFIFVPGNHCMHFQMLLLYAHKLFPNQLNLCEEYQQHEYFWKLVSVNASLYQLDEAQCNRKNSHLDCEQNKNKNSVILKLYNIAQKIHSYLLSAYD